MLEREAKLDVPIGFAVPDLTGSVEGQGVAPVEEKVLDAVYYDTEDLRLIRFGITLRYRDTWTVKLPDRASSVSGVMARDEIDVEGDATAIPPLARSLVTGVARGAPLVPVARLVTRRRRHRLLDADGEGVGEIDDDDVTVIDQEGNPVGRFREVEAEVGPDAPDELLSALVRRLVKAGASPGSSAPKVARALGPGASAMPDLVTREVGKRTPIFEFLQARLAAEVLALIEHHAGTVLGDSAAVGRMSLAMRAIRRDLRACTPLLDEEWVKGLQSELEWIIPAVTEVRQADLLVIVPGRRSDGDEALRALIEQARYRIFLERLVDGARRPRLRGDVDATSPAGVALHALASSAWAELRDAMSALASDPSPRAIRAAQRRVRRVRDVLDVGGPLLDGPAEPLAARLHAVERALRHRAPEVSADDPFDDVELPRRRPAGESRTWQGAWRQASEAAAWLS